MNEGMFGVIVLFTIAAICSVFFHHIIRQYRVAVLVSGLVGTVLFQLAAYLQAGYLDPFFLIAAFISFLVVCGLSALIGLVISNLRHRG